jgi:hypothetical protein
MKIHPSVVIVVDASAMADAVEGLFYVPLSGLVTWLLGTYVTVYSRRAPL